MNIEERRGKCDMTEHLLKFKFLPALVILLLLNFVRRDSSVLKIRASGARTILLLAAVIQIGMTLEVKKVGLSLSIRDSWLYA